jgi:TPR repeat protein
VAHDVFLSYSSQDKFAADAACAVLERNGIRVWMAPRDILPSDEWAEAIINAINSARVMVLVFSGNSNDSKQVRSEVERAINKGLPIIPFRIEDIQPRGSMELFLGAAHWLDAFSKPEEQHLDRLTEVVRRVIGAQNGEIDETPRRQRQVEPVPPRPKAALLAASALAAALALGGGWYALAPKPVVDAQQAEFDAAMQTGTIPALEAFVAKYPSGSLANAAKTARDRLAQQAADARDKAEAKRKADEAQSAAQTQQGDFDAVMQTGTVAALEAFVAKYPTGPLTNTAKRERDRLKAIAAASAEEERRKAAETQRAKQETERAALVKREAEEARKKGDAAYDAKDYAGAMSWYRKAADQGDANAQNNVGDLYFYGRGVAQDYAQAMFWYRKAADQGYTWGQFNVGWLCDSGKGVTQDYAQAASWYRKAADQGNAKSQNNLGDLYYYGRGVARDYAQAKFWYRKAADQGNADAKAALERLSK